MSVTGVLLIAGSDVYESLGSFLIIYVKCVFRHKKASLFTKARVSPRGETAADATLPTKPNNQNVLQPTPRQRYLSEGQHHPSTIIALATRPLRAPACLIYLT